MHVITAGTGQVGGALAKALLQKGQPVTIVSRSSKFAAQWQAQGARWAVADVYDTLALHEIFQTAQSVFLLNPPADPMTDTSVQERKTAMSLVEALRNTNVTKVVVASTLGAQPGESIGDLGVLYELEQAVSSLPYPYSIIRSAYYMSNWAPSLASAREKGVIFSFFPASLKLPMVAPEDIGELAAYLMLEKNTPQLTAIQGPQMYSATDVADAFAQVLQKAVRVEVIPRQSWIETFQTLGFSPQAAASYARMTERAINHLDVPSDYVRGETSLLEYISRLVTTP
jgi:uncharacterized protein YbjT (DUF2867 family)